MAADAVNFLAPGSNKGGADKLELFLKVFSGEVLSTFERVSKVRPHVRRRVLKSGKVAQFPAIGKVTAVYHTRGDSIISPGAGSYLSSVESGERNIYIDKRLIAAVLLDELDDLMAHWELRQDYAREIGRALATTDDQQLSQLIALGARATAAATADHPLGRVLYDATMATTGATLIKGIRVAAQILDENDVPRDGSRTCFLRPAEFNGLIQEASTFLDIRTGGKGSTAEGKLVSGFGFNFVMSNNLPSTNIATNPNQWGAGGSGDNTYSGDFTDTVALIMHKSGIGTAQLMGVRTSLTFEEEYESWFLKGKQAVGHGILREGSCIELSKSAAGVGLTNTTDLATFPNF